MAKRSKQKGWWVNPPDDVKERIQRGADEAMRSPGQEIAWILVQWFRARDAEKDRGGEE